MKSFFWIGIAWLIWPHCVGGQDKQLPIESTLEHSEVLVVSDSVTKVPLETPTGNLVQAKLCDGTNLDIAFNEDASKINLLIPSGAATSGGIYLLRAEKSVSLADGTVVLSALDATINGETARLESHPGNHRIGFWSDDKDSVSWTFQPSRWGKYHVDLVYSQAGAEGTVAEVSIAAKDSAPVTYEIELGTTGSWYRYTTINIGEHYFDDQTYNRIHQVKVTCGKKVGGAVMNLKAILLRPASEGEQPAAADEKGDFLFRSQDATVIGTRLVYEPNPKKLTLGWWTKVEDRARWDFSLSQAGTFDVQILQGCGKGQGGSRVAIDVLKSGARTTEPMEDDPLASVKFEVQDTGHFQNFKQRIIGQIELEPGDYVLQVRPIEKAKNAVMDLRELKLIRK